MKRSKHSLSHFRNTTFNMGELVPISVIETLPGDTIQMSSSLLIRTSPLLAPVMHPVHVRVHHWFVPHRLVWSDWQDFITGGRDGLNASVFPTITPNTGSGYAVGSLSDYLGIPTGVDDLPHSAIPHRAYALIWNEYYRDPVLQTPLTIDLTDGPDTTTNVTLQNVCWEKDYFTSARSSAQLGAAVTLPLGTSAPVKTQASNNFTGAQEGIHFLDATAGAALGGGKSLASGTGGNLGKIGESGSALAMASTNGIYPANLYADLAAATGSTINALRENFAIQNFLEHRNRYGPRYSAYLKFLGVQSSDARLQRPVYLGGGRQTIQFSEVLQQAVTTSGTPNTGVGAMLGHGIGAMKSNRFRAFIEEHGYVISLCSVLPKTMYVNGLNRAWSRSTKYDFWQKEFQHIGQQAVLNKEVYWAHATPNGTFGYQDRYDEYRRHESSVHGDFRSTLNYWHLGRIFGSDPALNAAFVSSDPATRIFQSTSSDQLYVMAMNSIQARRLVAKEGTSSNLGG